MKHIKLKNKVAEKDWSMSFVDEGDFHTLYDGDVYISKPDGSPLLVLRKNIIPKEICDKAWPIFKKIRMNTDNRSTSSGIQSEPRKKLDGTYSAVTRVPKGWGVLSAIIGNFERTPRIPYCRACSWNQKNPGLWKKLHPFLESVSNVFAENVPERYEAQKKWADKTPKEYIVGNTVYTTITVNHNYRTACHKDVGDLGEGFSNMAYLQQGKFKGGELVLPEWGIAVRLSHGDIVMFDAHEFHGNTRIIPISPDYDRCTIVCYYREKMIACLPLKEELKRVQMKAVK